MSAPPPGFEQPQQDRLNVTRHWIAQWDHGKVAVQAHAVWTAESADEHRANGWRVEGPFVLETSQEAVDRVAELESAITAACAMRGHPTGDARETLFDALGIPAEGQ